MTIRRLRYLGIVILLGCVTSVAVAGEQLRTLGAPDGERFTITDKVWPANPGQADVCLWKDDAMAAVSITIDDNTAPDHDWWVQTCQAYGIHVTWFVITDMVGTEAYRGTWDGFRNLQALGHDVQSHTLTHMVPNRGYNPDDPYDDEHGLIAEYRDSQAAIDAQIPDGRCLTLAYPGGNYSDDNDPAMAAQFYVAARGGTGRINQVNSISWMRTSSISGTLRISGNPWNSLESLFDKSIDLRFYRGWYCCHYHKLDDAAKAVLLAGLDYLQQKDAEVGAWIGTFREVALYGQSRDSATLTVTEATPERIAFTLSDRMDDTLYTYPLTVKVRLYDTWAGAQATQNGRPVLVRVIEHESATFALVDAVADQGPVELTPVGAAQPGDADGDGDVDLDDFVILKTTFGQSPLTDARADFDGDGDVDLGDFVTLKLNFGARP